MNCLAVIVLYWKAQYTEDLLYPGSRSKLNCFTAGLCLDQGCACLGDRQSQMKAVAECVLQNASRSPGNAPHSQ